MSQLEFDFSKKNTEVDVKNTEESIDHPKHYNYGKIEVIEVIEDWNLDFLLGNVIKYVGRSGKKTKSSELEDLSKAKWYLDRKIFSLSKKST